MARGRTVLLAAAWLLSGLAGRAPAGQGYDLVDNQVRVYRPSHWAVWEMASGIAQVTPEGAVSPRFLRRQVNAALDAPEYSVNLAGGAAAGCRPELAANLIDGDPSTFWEPDLDRSPDDWWVQVRLGRLVVVEKIVLRFVAEEQGDPFLQFEVLGLRYPPPKSSAQYRLLGTEINKFWRLFRTDRPNKVQRVFEVVPRTTETANSLFQGDPLDVIHVRVTDSDLARCAEVAESAYAALPADARGAVEYYRRGADGRQNPTTPQLYADLPPAQRGRIRYYRRERPRLAEVEVWTAGDNLNLGATRRGGRATLQTNAGPVDLATTVTDGDYTTGPSGSLFKNRINTFFEDLGALFWVDTLHFLLDGVDPIDEMAVEVSDGTRTPDGGVQWRRVAVTSAREERLLSSGGARYRAFAMEPAKVRYLRSLFQNPQKSPAYFTFVDVLLYGEGYVAEVELVSDLIELGGHKDLVSIHWDADVPPGTAVALASRTGNLLVEEKVYHDSDGKVVTEERYLTRLPRLKRGKVTTVPRPGADWSPWTRPYRYSGERILSPTPRHYLQLKARVQADTLSKYGRPAALRSITVQLADLYADQLLGEVWPCRVVHVGQSEERSLFIRPVFGTAGGFDEVQIAATAAATLELVAVSQGLEEELLQGRGRQLAASQVLRVPTASDTLWFRLPALVHQEGELLEVRMRTTMYANSVGLSAGVRSGAAGGSWQPVHAGDAARQANSQTMVVLALAGNAVITDPRVEPAVVTPNGDGINDRMRLGFSVSRIDAARRVEVRLVDLAGRTWREWIELRADPRGRYAVDWAGEDDRGSRVPPGLYLVRIQIAAESATAQRTELVRVVRVTY